MIAMAVGSAALPSAGGSVTVEGEKRADSVSGGIVLSSLREE